MELVTMYKTTDGKLFESAEDAELHEKLIGFLGWYEHHAIHTAAGKVSSEDIADWLITHRHTLHAMLRGTE